MGRNLKICMIAGERSGDLHAAEVASQILKSSPSAEIFGMGGKRMRDAGVEIIHDMTEIAVVGFSEVLKHFADFRRVFHDLLDTIEKRRPDAVVLIDLPGFNLRLGPRVKALGIPVIYYISPQVWAWGKRRTRKMRTFIDRFFVILPFEVDFYKHEGIHAEFVGHPLIDVLQAACTPREYRTKLGLDDHAKLVALLPGSRKQEIERILPLMIESAKRIREHVPDSTFVIPAASDYLKQLIEDSLRGHDLQMLVRTGETYDILNSADAAVVSSGTATLEAGWFGVPFVLVYRMSLPSYLIARSVARIDRIGLLNILAGETIATEYIQGNAKPGVIADEICRFLTDEELARKKREDLLRIRGLLGTGGAARRVADGIIEFINTKNAALHEGKAT